MSLVLTAMIVVTAALTFVSNAALGGCGDSFSTRAGCLSIFLPAGVTLLVAFGLAYHLAETCAPNCDGTGPVMLGLFGLAATIPTALGGGIGYILGGLWTGRQSTRDECE